MTTTIDADETLLEYGGEVKALAEEDGRMKIGGYVVLFGDATTPDLSRARDFFTKATDFNFDVAQKGRVRWHHGLDPQIGRAVLGLVDLKTDPDDVGVWAEGWISQRTAYEKKVGEWVKARKAGFSTGVPAHCVGRKAVGGCNEITEWPLGADISITLTPADPRQVGGVVSMKSLIEQDEQDTAVPASLIGRLRASVSDLAELKALTVDAKASRGQRGLSSAKREAVEDLADALKAASDEWHALIEPAAAVPPPVAEPVVTEPDPEDDADLLLRCQVAISRARVGD